MAKKSEEKERQQAPSMNIELNIYNASFVSFAIASIHLHIDTRSCTHNFMSIKQKQARRETKHTEKRVPWKMASEIYYEFPESIFFLCLSLVRYIIRFRCVLLFLHFVKQGKGISIQHLIQYSEFGIEVKEYWSDIEAT